MNLFLRKKYSSEIKAYKQVCVIPFTRDCLINYTRLEPTPLEIIESVDMNRLIESRYKIRMVKTKIHTINVDNQSDFDKAKIPLMTSLIKSITDNKKLEISW